MKIVNLTGRPQWMPTAIDEQCCTKLEELDYPNYNFLFRRFRNTLWQENEKVMLNECPVFLVETYKSRVYAKTEGGDIAVLVPTPMSEKAVAKQATEDSQEAGMVLEDYLGVYIYKPGAVLEHSIFIWVDRIQDAAQHDVDNSQALTTQVILHEYAHFLMNPAAYGDTPSSLYSYQKSECNYVEEACANAFSLAICYDAMTPKQQTFIEGFIKSQPQQYAYGWTLFSEEETGDVVNEWIQAKVLMDSDMLHELEHIFNRRSHGVGELTWDGHDIHYMLHDVQLYYSKDCSITDTECHKYIKDIWNGITYSDDGIHYGFLDKKGNAVTKPLFVDIMSVGPVNGEEAYAVKKNTKYAVITHKVAITGFLYDYVWSYGDDGLCQVAIDDADGNRMYGYIDQEGNEVIEPVWYHLYNFENGLTPAKRRNDYCIINTCGEIVVDDLAYDDIRAFINGKAFAKRNGKWGAIDYTGKEVVECKYDKFPRL